MAQYAKWFGTGKSEDKSRKAEFNKWVGSNYGPPGRISRDDLNILYEEWMKKQKPKQNSMSGARSNALAG